MIPRAMVWLAFLGAGVALALLLGGCAAPQLLRGSGEVTPPPIGYVVDCARQPAQEHCG